jgi:hypothetical protein
MKGLLLLLLTWSVHSLLFLWERLTKINLLSGGWRYRTRFLSLHMVFLSHLSSVVITKLANSWVSSHCYLSKFHWWFILIQRSWTLWYMQWLHPVRPLTSISSRKHLNKSNLGLESSEVKTECLKRPHSTLYPACCNSEGHMQKLQRSWKVIRVPQLF